MLSAARSPEGVASERGTSAPIWIVSYYGSLPSEGLREFRTTLLARALVKRGYRVVWWASAFDHVTKKQRPTKDIDSGVAGLQVRLIAAPAYIGNITFRRVWSEWRFGRNWRRTVRSEKSPLAIILIDPARFYGDAVAKVARSTNRKLALDVMDLWPELFLMAAPPRLRPIFRLLLAPLRRQRERLVKQAHVLTGVTKDYVDAVAASAPASKPRHVTLLGSHPRMRQLSSIPPSLRAAVDKSGGVSSLALYAGTLGENYDIAALIGAARSLAHRADIRWIVAGAGPMEPEVRAAAKDLGPHRFMYLGLQEADAVAWLMRQCDVGLSCYAAESTVSMPWKAFDYIAAGLPLINSLGRELGRLVEERKVGVQYAAGNPHSLADAVIRMNDDAELRTQCAANAIALAPEYEPDRLYDAYAEFLSKTGFLDAPIQ